MDTSWRILTDFERALLERLLEAIQVGRDELLEQSRVARVRTIDENGSIEFGFETGHPAPTHNRAPVYAFFENSDPPWVQLNLIVNEGFLGELEIYTRDGSPIAELADVSDVVGIPWSR